MPNPPPISRRGCWGPPRDCPFPPLPSLLRCAAALSLASSPGLPRSRPATATLPSPKPSVKVDARPQTAQGLTKWRGIRGRLGVVRALRPSSSKRALRPVSAKSATVSLDVDVDGAGSDGPPGAGSPGVTPPHSPGLPPARSASTVRRAESASGSKSPMGSSTGSLSPATPKRTPSIGGGDSARPASAAKSPQKAASLRGASPAASPKRPAAAAAVVASPERTADASDGESPQVVIAAPSISVSVSSLRKRPGSSPPLLSATLMRTLDDLSDGISDVCSESTTTSSDLHYTVVQSAEVWGGAPERPHRVVVGQGLLGGEVALKCGHEVRQLLCPRTCRSRETLT